MFFKNLSLRLSKFVTAPRTICFGFLAMISLGTLLLIQVGGLGYMTATTFLLLLLGRRFGLRERLALQQSLDTPGLSGVVQLVKSIIAMTLIFELTGAFLMIPVFAQQHGFDRALWLGLFHSVSAFNNAGFGLFPDNMISYATNLPINLIIPFLIIFGGIGYQVISEMYMWLRDRITRSRERIVFPLNFKIVTSTTVFLLLLGTIAFLLVEYRNEETFGQYNFSGKLMVAWFQAVVPRTAGFNSIDYGKMGDAGLFITIALMFIGASPGSTGGGIKTTTFRVMFECTKAVLQGKFEVLCYQREIPAVLIRKSIGVVFGSLTTVIIATILIAISDPEVEFIRILFEAVSAFATVGLSTGITASVTVFAKLVLICTMYVGRVGVLLLMSAIVGDPSPTLVRYPEENLLVG